MIRDRFGYREGVGNDQLFRCRKGNHNLLNTEKDYVDLNRKIYPFVVSQ